MCFVFTCGRHLSSGGRQINSASSSDGQRQQPVSLESSIRAAISSGRRVLAGILAALRLRGNRRWVPSVAASPVGYDAAPAWRGGRAVVHACWETPWRRSRDAVNDLHRARGRAKHGPIKQLSSGGPCRRPGRMSRYHIRRPARRVEDAEGSHFLRSRNHRLHCCRQAQLAGAAFGDGGRCSSKRPQATVLHTRERPRARVGQNFDARDGDARRPDEFVDRGVAFSACRP